MMMSSSVPSRSRYRPSSIASGSAARDDREPLVEPRTGPFAQIRLQLGARRHWIVRKKVGIEIDGDIAALGDLQAVFDCCFEPAEALPHLRPRREVLLRGVAAWPARIVQSAPLLDADARLVGFEVIRIQKAHVIARHHWNIQFRGQPERGGEVGLL